MQMALPHAAFDGWNLRGSQPQLGVQRADLIANAQFAEAPETVSDVGADVDAVDAVIRERIVLRVNLKSCVAGVAVRHEKPVTVRSERTIEFSLNAVGVPEKQIGTPF